jgi:hypothetical protein
VLTYATNSAEKQCLEAHTRDASHVFMETEKYQWQAVVELVESDLDGDTVSCWV